MNNMKTPTVDLLGSRVAITCLEGLRECIHQLAAAQTPSYVCFATAHMIVAATRDASIRDAYRGANVISPDGMPVAWLLHLLGARNSHCVSGPRAMPLLLEMASENDLPVGFYGGRPDTLVRISQRITREYPRLHVAYTCSPPFRPLSFEEQERDICDINQSKVRILFVGLGSPRQECWMHRFSPRLSCVCLGVGGAFEFFSGEKHLPPFWVQSLGLTWLIRLLQEPRRLIARNLYSPVYVCMALRWVAMNTQQRLEWEDAIAKRLAARFAAGLGGIPHGIELSGARNGGIGRIRT